MPTHPERPRGQLRFWLNLSKEDQYLLWLYCENLKQRRQFVTTIRNGLRLMRDLSEGKVDVLLDLFPWIAEYFASKNNADLQSILDELQGLRQSIKQAPTAVQTLQALEPSSRSTSKPLEPMPELEITVNQTKSNEIPAYNIALSGIGIGSVKVHEIPEHILRYAVDMSKLTGKTLAEAKRILEQSTDDQPKPPTPKPTTGSPKKMDVPAALPPPVFDDLPDLL